MKQQAVREKIATEVKLFALMLLTLYLLLHTCQFPRCAKICPVNCGVVTRTVELNRFTEDDERVWRNAKICCFDKHIQDCAAHIEMDS